MCNCKEELEKKLTDHQIKSTPISKGHKVALKGYGIVLTDSGCRYRGFMEYEVFELAPLKKGGHKPKKTRGNMFFSYCPFCGKKAE